MAEKVKEAGKTLKVWHGFSLCIATTTCIKSALIIVPSAFLR